MIASAPNRTRRRSLTLGVDGRAEVARVEVCATRRIVYRVIAVSHGGAEWPGVGEGGRETPSRARARTTRCPPWGRDFD